VARALETWIIGKHHMEALLADKPAWPLRSQINPCRPGRDPASCREYGEEWHLAGKGSTKPNTWRDFNACAQYLINNKYTSPSHLAGEGESAGGILIGRAITDRPDLWGAAIDIVGCSDMLSAETTANGLPNVPEFGSTKTEDSFKAGSP
jgi:prolyl oligopeptidase